MRASKQRSSAILMLLLRPWRKKVDGCSRRRHVISGFSATSTLALC
jgi:threonine/homoserine efflux transporter RhtA